MGINPPMTTDQDLYDRCKVLLQHWDESNPRGVGEETLVVKLARRFVVERDIPEELKASYERMRAYWPLRDTDDIEHPYRTKRKAGLIFEDFDYQWDLNSILSHIFSN
jgi:hypothetical protein